MGFTSVKSLKKNTEANQKELDLERRYGNTKYPFLLLTETDPHPSVLLSNVCLFRLFQWVYFGRKDAEGPRWSHLSSKNITLPLDW